MLGDIRENLSRTLYQELRGIAAGQLRAERPDHTLQPTALVHEAFLRLREQRNLDPADRPALLAIAARQMRQVLIDHARRRRRVKRGGAARRLSLQSHDLGAHDVRLDLVDLDDALNRLARLSPRQADVVTLRFFGGMSHGEVAAALEVSPRTVEGDWLFARAWLRRELLEVASDDPA